MFSKIVIPVFGIALLISCDTTPASEDDDNNKTDREPSEGVSSETFETNRNKASIVAMSDIENPENEGFTGKAYFTLQQNNFTLTLILNNTDPKEHLVYLLKNVSCENPKLPKQQNTNADGYPGKIGSLEVLDGGSGRTEIILREFTKTSAEQINKYIIVVAKPDGEISGCGQIKKYVEQQNLSK